MSLGDIIASRSTITITKLFMPSGCASIGINPNEKCQFSVKNLNYVMDNYIPWVNKVNPSLPRIFTEQGYR